MKDEIKLRHMLIQLKGQEYKYLYNQIICRTAKMSAIQVTKDAVELLSQEVEQEFVVQITSVRKMKSNTRITCDISDGIFKIKAYITDHTITEDDSNAFILIKNFGVLRQQERLVGIVVQTCEILDYYEQQLGNSVDFLRENSKQEQVFKENPPKIQQQKLRSYQKKHGKNGHSPIQKVEKKKTFFQEIEQSPIDCEKISQLYPDLQNWEIVTKIIKKTYREFVSKNGKGKLTKVMNVELMDQTGTRITGAMFGESAKDFFQNLVEEEIYKVSKGQIREDQYNQNKGKNYSKFTIMLTRNSQFKKILHSKHLLEKFRTQLAEISKIYLDPHINEQYDSVGILVQVQDEVEIPKENKTLYKKVLALCDPQNEKVMEAIIWNRSLEVEKNMIGRTVGLYGFRLNLYNQSLSLNSSYHSDIKIISNHRYTSFEGRINKDRLEFLSQKKQKNIEIEEACKNLKELETELSYLESGKEIKSTMCLTLTLLSYKKWYYESCPHCRKSAEPYNKCNSCENYIDQTIPRYKLNVQLSDSCGSIWATGFQELGAKLFGEYPEGIKFVRSLDEGERHRLFEKKQFQQYTFKLTSKLDRDGNVKHTVNRVYDINTASKTVENIGRIKGYI